MDLLFMNSGSKNYPYIIGISGKAGAGKSTLSSMLAVQLEATLIAWDDYDEIELVDLIEWHRSGGLDYSAFKRKFLSKNLEELKNNKEAIHPASNQVLRGTQFIIFDAPLGRLHQETGRFIDTMIHIEVPLDVLLCRRLLRDFKDQTKTKDLLLEAVRSYLEQSRSSYFDDDLKDTADLIVDGMLPPEQKLIDVMDYLTKQGLKTPSSSNLPIYP